MLKKFIILGYGNPDRGDDGVAYYLLQRIIQHFGTDASKLAEFEEVGLCEVNGQIDIWYNLQLIPEISQELALYENAIFIDAHTAEIPQPILITGITPQYQNSPFTHHLTPASCLSLAEKLYQHVPHATLVTIRGYQFDFSRELSSQTSALADTAFEEICRIMAQA
jgi:hydrogenase maturation protease